MRCFLFQFGLMTAGNDGKSFLAEIDNNVVQLTLNDYDREELEKLEIKNKPKGLSIAYTTKANYYP